jgi:hypothetical protein
VKRYVFALCSDPKVPFVARILNSFLVVPEKASDDRRAVRSAIYSQVDR